MPIEKVTLTTPDISCDHCINSIKKAMGKLPGVVFLDANVATKQVTLQYDPDQTQLAAIEAALDEEGYPVAK